MKKEIIIILYIFFSVACCHAVSPIVVDQNYKTEPIGKQTQFFLTSENLTLAEVKTKGKAFVPTNQEILNLGFNKNNCWIKFTVTNLTVNKDYLISVSQGLLDYVDLHFFETSNPGKVTTIKTGDQLPVSTRPIKHRKFLFPVKIENEITVYIRARTTGVLTIPIEVWEPYAFFEYDIISTLLYGLHYGMIIVMIVYNLFIYIVTKDKAYAIYVLHVTSLMFIQLGLNGFINEIGLYPTWNNQSLGFFIGLYFYSLLLFTRTFLKIERFYPRLNKLINQALLLLGALTIASIVIPYGKLVKIYSCLGLILPVVLIILPLSLVNKYKPSRYFSAATFFLLLGIVTIALMCFGLIPNNAIVRATPQFGFTIEIIILSFGLAAKINFMKKKIELRNQELITLNSLKDNFLANTTHELKTPLHGIIGLADTIKSGNHQLSAKVKLNLDIIIKSAQRLSVLVNDILDIQRLKYANVKLDLRSFDLNQVVSVISALSRPLLKSRVTIINNIPPGIYVFANLNRTYQIVQNLVSNSCQFTKSGSITITAEQKPDAMISVSVKDTGCGIAPEDQQRVFKVFEQAKALPTGTGLGLSIAKELVELQGGQLELKSEIGKGSEISFTIPAGKKSESQNVEQLINANVIKYSDETDLCNDDQMNESGNTLILVVDDEPVNLQVVADYLQMTGYNVQKCSSGQEALDSLAAQKPALILLDIMMPNIDGFKVCEQIRTKYSQLEVPVIFMTAKNQIKDLIQGYALGANDYLTKPFLKNELIARVKCQLSIVQAKDRLVSLRIFANKLHRFKNVDTLKRELFNCVATDPKVSAVATFLNGRVTKSTTSDNQAYITVFENWQTGTAPKDYVFLSLEGIKNYILMIALKPEASPLDVEYFKNLKAQAEMIVYNFRRLISDTYFIEDIHTLSVQKKYIRYIKTRGGQTLLYEDKHESILYLRSSLNTIECFFSDTLIRVNRSCLINPKKIQGMNFNQDGRRNKTTVNVDGEIIAISDNLLDGFPSEIKKKFMGNG